MAHPDARPPRILLIRLSAIGDVIMASGLIPALREAFPGARIGWLTEAGNADLLRHNPRLDRLHLWPRGRWRELRRNGQYRRWLGEVRDFLRDLRGVDYDLVLDLQGLMKSGLWAFLCGGRFRVGLGSREGSGWLMQVVLSRRVESVLIGKEYRQLGEFLGAPPAAFRLDIAVAEADRAAAGELLRAAGVAGAYAVIAPFTTRPQKHWFDARWADLARGLTARHGWPVVMLGGPGDLERAAAIAALAGGGIVDLAGKTRLGSCAAVIAGARLLVGVDTGLTHLGIARGVPTVALFGSTRPYLDTGRRDARVLYQPMDCSPCRRRPSCGGSFDCMARHTPESVLAAVTEILRAAPANG